MGETLLGKLYGLTHEDMIKAHHLFTATAKTTPYQLDLEVKGRKPDIVPKVGDKVKIKSREWYEKWKDDNGEVTGLGTHVFLPDMSKYCGKVFKVKNESISAFGLEDAHFGWIMPMFEEVYPQESSKEERYVKTFDSSSITASALGKQLAAASFIPEINPIQGTGFSYDLGTLSRQVANIKAWSDSSTRITLPQQNLFCSPGFYRQSVLKDEDPELQTIKKHRFIKLENL